MRGYAIGTPVLWISKDASELEFPAAQYLFEPPGVPRFAEDVSGAEIPSDIPGGCKFDPFSAQLWYKYQDEHCALGDI